MAEQKESSPLRAWVSKHAHPEMRDNQVYISLDGSDDEVEELMLILKTDTEKYSLKFLDALDRIGIPVCMECRAVIFEDKKCECKK